MLYVNKYNNVFNEYLDIFLIKDVYYDEKIYGKFD